jgi:transposase InsO family protein
MRASQGWSGVETARVFQVTPDTIRSWEKEATNPDTKLLERSQPVNTYADFVRLVVCRLKVLCPALGKKKIAQFLARAGLHLAVSTVGRMTSSPPRSPRSVSASAEQSTIVRADRPGKVWHVDLTIVPTSRFYVPWMPHALPQCWPFCWWLAAVIDHYSRACIGFTVFLKEPTARQVLDFLDSVVKQRGKPRYIISDKGPQFDCDQYKGWCKRRHVRPRFGAIGKHGSIAVIERFFRSFKGECMRRILVPYNLDDVRHEIELYVTWYNNLRPHETLDGATPFEIHEGIQPANQLRRLEPRQHWPRGSPCAAPAVDIEGDPGIRFELHLEFVEGRKHLPIIELRKVA